MKRILILLLFCIVLICNAEFPQSSEISKKADLPNYLYQDDNTGVERECPDVFKYDLYTGYTEKDDNTFSLFLDGRLIMEVSKEDNPDMYEWLRRMNVHFGS